MGRRILFRAGTILFLILLLIAGALLVSRLASRGGAARFAVPSLASSSPPAAHGSATIADRALWPGRDPSASAREGQPPDSAAGDFVDPAPAVPPPGDPHSPGLDGERGAEGPESLEGTVRSPDGEPIPDARLRMLPAGGQARQTGAAVRSDAAGRFRFQRLTPGPWLLSAERSGFLSRHGIEIEVPVSTAVAVLLPPDRPARVLILDPAGLPLPGARIEARPEAAGGAPPALGLARRASAAANGEAWLEGLPAEDASPLLLTAQLAGRPPARLRRTAGEMRGATTRMVIPRGLVIAGEVVDAKGEAAADAELLLVLDPGGEERPAESKLRDRWTLHSTALGRFRFEGLPVGSFILYAGGGAKGGRRLPGIEGTAEGDPPLRVELAPAAAAGAQAGSGGEEGGPPPAAARVRSLPFARADLGTIRGKVVGPEPLPRFEISLEPETPGDDRRGRTFRQSGNRGEFTIPAVTPGVYRILVLVGGQARARADGIAVDPGSTAGPIELRLDFE